MRLRNNFDLLRLILSLTVLFSHCPPINGSERVWLESYLFDPWEMAFGTLAVYSFFGVSGYLVTQSYGRTGYLKIFGMHRFLRIMPALIPAAIFSHLMFQRYNGYASNPLPSPNGSLWSISWEVACYVVVAMLGSLKILTQKNFNIFFAICWLIYILDHFSADIFYIKIAPALMFFLMGMYIAINEDHINIRKAGPVALGVMALASCQPLNFWLLDAYKWIPQTPFGGYFSDQWIHIVALTVATPYALIYIAKCTRPLKALRYDISYGVYLYSWPIQEIVVYEARKHALTLTGTEVFLIALPVVIMLASISCFVIERPALRLKRMMPVKIQHASIVE